MARAIHRKPNDNKLLHLQALGAQELMHNRHLLKLNIKHSKLTIATLNVTTLAQLAQRQLIEKWMQEYKIDILCIQETKIKNNGHEKRQKNYMVF